MNTRSPTPLRQSRFSSNERGGGPRILRCAACAALSLVIALAAAPALAVDCNAFKLWTFNIRFNDGWACASDCDNSWYRVGGAIARRDVAESYLKAYAPDIFGLQEVKNPVESAGVRVSQLKDVAGWFPNHAYYAKDRGDGEHCAIFYRTARFARLNAGTFWMSCFPDVEGSMHPLDVSSGNPRITSWVQLLDLSTGATFFVFNGHWSLNSSARRYDGALIRQRVQQLAGNSPVILIGDFNCEETDTEFKILTGVASYTGSDDCPIQPIPVPQASLPLVNTYRQVYPIPGGDEDTFHNFNGGISGDRIDHVLHSPEQFAALSATIRRDTFPGHCSQSECYPSDHYALEIRFRMLLDNVRVDFNRSEAQCETGTPQSPFNTLSEALGTVKANGTITLQAGSTSAGITINPTRGPVKITAVGGLAAIGR